MPSSQVLGVTLASLLVFLVCSATAQDGITYLTNGARVLVPVGQEIKDLPPVNQKSASEYSDVIDNAAKPETFSPYEFGFALNDGNGTTQHRQEIRKENGDVQGSYGYVDPLGVYRRVEYYTDATGYHAKVKSNEPGLSNRNSANTIFVVENPPASAIFPEQRPVIVIPSRPVA
ncbi:cuticle protein 16.8-like [Stegodyphus dumicola]|uniref:cuticle protein 16.8-like n=1 Tax=Stegodyphus dumicola TaxID=202533 RepID=UPI0015B10E90|nr:cuticle protein 16.8-like [Stegodyphus dumicola]